MYSCLTKALVKYRTLRYIKKPWLFLRGRDQRFPLANNQTDLSNYLIYMKKISFQKFKSRQKSS